MNRRRSLYEIPSLPDAMLKQKYIQTPDVYNDPNTVSNFMKEMLRNTGPDAPIFEQDMPRQSRNAGGQSLLSMQEHGSRYSHTPYHPELFLGDLTKDPRMSTNEPLVSQMAEQNKFRQERYIRGKLQDVADVRSEGVIGTKRMVKQIKLGFDNMATRMGGIFDDSTGNMVARTNPNPGNSIHKVGDTLKEDQTIYQIGDEKILPHYGTDIVSKLSNMVGIQWQVQPDAKVGLSSVSNIYRSKQEVDRAANAVFRLANQDTRFKTEQKGIKKSSFVPDIDSVKNARRDKQNVEVYMSKDSVKSNKVGAALPSGPVDYVSQSVGTQSAKGQMETKGQVYKFTPGNNIIESLVEPLKSKSMATKGRTMQIPVKDKMANLHQIKQTQKNAIRREDVIGKGKMGIKNLTNAFTKKPDSLQERIVKDQNQTVRYINGIPVKAVDHVSNNKMTTSKFTQNKEQLSSNPTGSTTMIAPSNTNSFRFDMDPTMDNSYMTRRGSIQRATQLSSMQEFDNEVSPLSDGITPFRTNYNK